MRQVDGPQLCADAASAIQAALAVDTSEGICATSCVLAVADDQLDLGVIIVIGL